MKSRLGAAVRRPSGVRHPGPTCALSAERATAGTGGSVEPRRGRTARVAGCRLPGAAQRGRGRSGTSPRRARFPQRSPVAVDMLMSTSPKQVVAALRAIPRGHRRSSARDRLPCHDPAVSVNATTTGRCRPASISHPLDWSTSSGWIHFAMFLSPLIRDSGHAAAGRGARSQCSPSSRRGPSPSSSPAEMAATTCSCSVLDGCRCCASSTGIAYESMSLTAASALAGSTGVCDKQSAGRQPRRSRGCSQESATRCPRRVGGVLDITLSGRWGPGAALVASQRGSFAASDDSRLAAFGTARLLGLVLASSRHPLACIAADESARDAT